MNPTLKTRAERLAEARTVTKSKLFGAFGAGKPVTLGETQFHVLNSIEREDGSNRKYNVTGINPYGHRVVLFVETVD